ncbi:glutamine amidotransferase [Haloarchaeobius sp. TZWSO28]|uniref:glutamine amidotransferase n=1 Tax=Haloarchaeobius sp. TZWSO28 TaxID=3446119 RepID=UPI003EBFA86A
MSDESTTSPRVLLAGESWYTVSFEVKGRDVIADGEYVEAADFLIAALEVAGAEVDFQPCHVAIEAFPRTRDELDEYDLVILSDIGADSLQVTPAVAGGDTDVDRCELLADYVSDGGALGMIGGYMSFAGKGGLARYGLTALADVLPVEIARTDDRVEVPGGVRPQTGDVPDGVDLPPEWPAVLGYNRLEATAGADVWVTVGADPLLVVGSYGEGRTFAFATDCAPHWAPLDFLEWDRLPDVWRTLLAHLTD